LEYIHHSLIQAKEEEEEGSEEGRERSRLSHVRRKARVSTVGLGIFFCRFNLEEGRERRTTKVT